MPTKNLPLTILLLLLLLTQTPNLSASEFRPVSAWTAGETHPTPNGDYNIDKLCDGDLTTYACLLDDSRTGKDPKSGPAFGSAPVTASFVIDLGESKTVSGLRLIARNKWVVTMASSVSVFRCDDAKGTGNLKPLAENQTLPPVINSYSAFVTWDAVACRYLKIQVHDANQKPYNFPWKGQLYEWASRNGDALSSQANLYNVQIAEVRCFDELPADFVAPNADDQANPDDQAYPQDRLERDWLYQDAGLDVSRVFWSTNGNQAEKKLVEKAIQDGQKAQDAAAAPSEAVVSPQFAAVSRELQKLLAENVPGADPRWRALYVKACSVRRQIRLSFVRAQAESFIYVKHHIFGSNQGLVGKYDIPDEQTKWNDRIPATVFGSQLCRGTIRPDGTIAHEVLLNKPNGTICDPSLSWDAQTLVFSMRDNYETDSYYLYTMDLSTRAVKQITFPLKSADGQTVLHVADCEPAWLPNGEIVFASTRGVHISDCWYRAAGDIYKCNADGTEIRRLTFDQLMTNLPQVLEDGRIVYTRWEYNDRTALYLHPLFVMNPDGTGQTEYYGNNSMFPSSLTFAQGIPGSKKVLAIVGGHHTPYKGKLALIDRSEGTQAGEGIEFVAGAAPDRTPGRKKMIVAPTGFNDFMIDIFGQDGPQYVYPFAFDETNYFCSFNPEGYIRLYGPYYPPFGAYYMQADGARELLAFDWKQSTGRIIPVKTRVQPPIRVDSTDPSQNDGTFYIQNVNLGPGLEGVPEGTVKKLRVVALEYRTCRMGYGQNGGECETGLCQTPISLNSGSWDVKHVLGEVDVEEDGSCSFAVPAHAPVFFQLLDEKGCCVQSMRSWATLMPGERFACLGCHENKNDVLPPSQRKLTIAMRKPIQTLKPFAGKEHPLVGRLKTQNWTDSVDNYLGVNALRSLAPNAPVDGFSYRQEIQPILDRHCVRCHTGETDNPDPEKRSKLCLTGEVAAPESIKLIGEGAVDPKRAYTRSYVELTTSGNPDVNPWMKWLKPRSRTVMLPPYHIGSCKSKIMDFLEPTHYNVQLTSDEKRVFACWIDLLIPFCGSYPDANTWTGEEKAEVQYFQNKRFHYAEEELKTINKR